MWWRRLGSTLILWGAVLGALIWRWEPAILFCIGAVALAGLWEFYRMLEQGGLPCDRRAGLAAGVLFFAAGLPIMLRAGPHQTHEFELAFMSVGLVALGMRQVFVPGAPRRESVLNIALTLLGLLYVPWLMNFMAKIYALAPRGGEGQPDGVFYLLYLLMTTKFSDIGAYCTGSLLGRHKMIPRISPGKTWEGFTGALASSALVSWGLVMLFPARLAPITPGAAVLLGVGFSVAAVLGDLLESLLKRACAIKDSGGLLPGIGGVLDLIDSLLFTAPLLYLYLRIAS